MATIDQRVAKGAALLDRDGPEGWRGRIDCETLDLARCRDCILGQVYGEYGTGVGKLGANFLPVDCGFERTNTERSAGTPLGVVKGQYWRLTAAWRRLLDC